MRALPRLMVAPNGARRGKADHPALPVTLPEIVETARACFSAGADGLHLHLRDGEGRHLLDAGAYREALAELRRAVPEMAAEEAEAPGFYTACAERGIAVQHILYNAADFDLLARLVPQCLRDAAGVQMVFVLGRYSDGQESGARDLEPFLKRLAAREAPADWALCAFGRAETACLCAAYAAGGKLRVGFENSLWHADGKAARDNAERVREVVEVCGLGSGWLG